ncbi:MAG: hypothetical protein IPL99_04290 [Candidatus Competibacteraceae bacterium]|nr:hypothetical protein [Candidatus Competibacteraceae bacterium]
MRSEQLLEETKDRMNPVGFLARCPTSPGAATAPEVATARIRRPVAKSGCSSRTAAH